MPEAADSDRPDAGSSDPSTTRPEVGSGRPADVAGSAGPSTTRPEAGSGRPTDDRGGGTGPSPTLRVGRGALAVGGVLVAYYAVPVGEMPSSWGILFAAGGVLAGLGVLVWVALRQLRVLARYETGHPGVRLDVLVLLVVVVVPLFALGYYAIERGDSSQFAELETKTDALYFTMSTLATVGFGDVHAAGELARALVTVQIAFDVVFVAALVSVLTAQLRARAAERRSGPGS
jgi:voltage-gated potassium channel